MWIEWQIRWRGSTWNVRWEDGALDGDAAAAEAFERYALSNAPDVNLPATERLGDAEAVAAMMTEFADAILATRSGGEDGVLRTEY